VLIAYEGPAQIINGPLEFRNSGDTRLNSHCPHSPLEAGTETRTVNVGDTHDPPLEELSAAYGQKNEYGVHRIPQIDGSVT